MLLLKLEHIDIFCRGWMCFGCCMYVSIDKKQGCIFSGFDFSDCKWYNSDCVSFKKMV